MLVTQYLVGNKHRWLDQLDKLRDTDAHTRFLSLGLLPDLALDGIDWVITGGEFGPGARPMDAAWVRDIRDNCEKQGSVRLQAVGQRVQETQRADSGWQNMGSEAGTQINI